ncbi:hypothetical protein Nepgr_001119 [Nepenthes gracilis]|uniref:Anaphase-promoting complex subunit 4-like WD40 domain-containing protein n=1 Tax=Nepenthes gracilis TaxID=150966 RepID=A0AAD3P2C8_NEPGR|nr:hypothetical protein Nepgr_001119 [Nepenthes gracilis]
MALLAASGGDTVKLFDVSVESGDPCMLSYSPSPGFQVNSIKWNHTNLVVASAGDDRKVTLWRTNGQSMGTIPVSATDSGDNIEEDIFSINFSNKGSRYLCSGGSGQVVRIWDLQRKRCIKWLRGHTSTITCLMYNCKDEHLASISLSGDLILHNLASGAKAAELKDPSKQVLRVLDYSRISRHLLVTAGDDGSLHLWDTTGRTPKVSWLKQHSAPTAGVSFSPSNDKIIASVGLDKKLYTFDSGSRRPSFCIAYEAPFSSLAFRDDGWILAAGTSSGRVVFYDVRGKPHPFTVLRAYGSSEAVSSLCWQRSKPVVVNEKNCTDEAALLEGAVEDSILMPDPLPPTTSLSLSQSTTMSGPRNSGQSGYSVESLSLGPTSGGSTSTLKLSTSEETPRRSLLWTGGTLGRLHASRSYNFTDDMEVFSPLVDVQPLIPSLDKLWNELDGTKKDQPEKAPQLFSGRGVPLSEEGGANLHPVFDWKSSSIPKQDDLHSVKQIGSAAASSKTDDSSSITPPEAWGGERLLDKLAHQRQIGTMPSRFSMSTSSGMTSMPMFSGFPDSSFSTRQMNMNSLTSSSISFANLYAKDISFSQESSAGISGHVPSISLSLPPGTRPVTGLESTGPVSLALPPKPSTYAERISSTSFGDGISASIGSPKTKKTGAETREELLSSLLSRSDALPAADPRILSFINEAITHRPKPSSQSDTQQQGSSSFTLQLFQRTLEETLASFQRSIHEDVRNLHIEILRQFHMQEVEMSSAMTSILDNQAELMKEVQALKKENQRLRQLL